MEYNIEYKIKILIKSQFLLINILFLFIRILKKRNIALCTIGKNENKYIREFIEHYKNYGVDKIFLYDNNDFNGENFSDILSDYIKSSLVQIINFKGMKRPQIKSYKDCYKKNYKYYNWLIFFDIDEFIYLKNFQNIKDFLNQKKFNKCQRIQLNWIFHTDNNLLYYENKSLAKRFPIREKKARGQKKGGWPGIKSGIKSIIRGNINISVIDVHIISPELISCDGFGNIQKIENIVTNVSDFYYYYIDHYYCKSTEEFIKKVLRSDGCHELTDKLKYLKLEVYFGLNEITKEKIDFIEKETKLNLSKYRKYIKN